MVIKKHLKNAINNFSLAYVILMIGYLLFSTMGVWKELNNERAIQLLVICFCANFASFLTAVLLTALNNQYYFVEVLLDGLEIFGIVLFLGGKIFHMFEYSFSDMLGIAAMLLVICVVVGTISYVNDLQEIQRINDMIEKRKNKKTK